MMLQNTLLIIEKTTKKIVSNEKTQRLIVEFFKNYKKNMWIYPGVLKRKFSLELVDIYELLNDLEKQGVMQRYYELYCSECQKSIGLVRMFNELPETFECELCHRELLTVENSLLIYKVVRDD